ncbi:MAG: hypothetical protein F6J95_014620 [Leptolyngbya sp. SIO1E4]|nr:hypothetical protein [Leptolyngbya sp. SIO1E4]
MQLMNRAPFPRPYPLVEATEVGSAIPIRPQRPTLVARWSLTDGQLTCKWIVE